MKIQLTGTRDEVSKTIATLSKLFTGVSETRVSPVYDNASHPGCAQPIPGMARVYLEVTQ